MAIFKLLPDDLWFPGPELFDPDQGVVAMGGDLSANRLLEAYYQGIFPWSNPGEPLLWWHPLHRFILPPAEVKVSKSSRNLLNQKKFEITFNRDFSRVIENCQQIYRPGQSDTWISDELKHSMIELHHRGHAHSVEAWQDGELAGGLYGLAVGTVFCGDSMFSKVSNASKMAFIHLCRRLEAKGFDLIDCQVKTPHLARMGAFEIPRESFIALLKRSREKKHPGDTFKAELD